MRERKLFFTGYGDQYLDRLLERPIDYLRENKGDRFIYILPNGNLLTDYRRNFLDLVGGAGSLNIFTFDDIGKKFKRKRQQFSVSEELKILILKEVLEDLIYSGEISYYKNMAGKQGFIRNLSSIIGEFKSSLLTYDRLVDSDLGPKYRELGLIYREYEKRLRDNDLMDLEDDLVYTIEDLKNRDQGFLRQIDFIVIDKFYDFRPSEFEILGELSKLDLDIYINMPFRRSRNYTTVETSLEAIRDLGFQIELGEEGGHYFQDLSSSIFSGSKLPARDNIVLIKAASKYLELKELCHYIKLEERRGIDLDQMALVLSNKEDYRDLVKEVFEEERIPHSLRIDKVLISTPIFNEILGILNFIYEPSKSSFIARLKSRYFPIVDRNLVDPIEYILRRDCANLQDLEAFLADEDLRLAMKEARILLDREREIFSQAEFLNQYNQALLGIFNLYNLEERVYQLYLSLGDQDLLYRDLNTLELMEESLEETSNLKNELLGKMSMEEFIDYIRAFGELVSVKEREGNIRGVKVLSPEVARGKSYKAVFVVGMAQGQYPRLERKNFLFRDDKKDELLSLGLDYKDYYERLDKASVNFSNIISLAEEKLYLSYSQNADENEEAIASIFLDELIYTIDGDLNFIERPLDSVIKEDLGAIGTREDFLNFSLAGELTRENIGRANSIFKTRMKDIYRKSYCELKRYEGPSAYNGILEDSDLIDEIGSKLKSKKFSASFLDRYGNCPFSFYLSYIVRLEEMVRDREEFSPLDRGEINHKVLQDFYASHKVEIQSYLMEDIDFDREDFYLYIYERYKKQLETRGLDTSRAKYKLILKTNADLIFNFILADLRRIKSFDEKFYPLALEEEFHSLKLGKLEFRGVIDRIDRFESREDLIVVDYKNSIYGVRKLEDSYEGRSFQMPLYAMALESLGHRVSLCQYGIIRSAAFEDYFIRDDERAFFSRKSKKVLSQEDKEELFKFIEEKAKDYIDRIFSGDFRLAPLDCSYCPYKNICRVREEDFR